MSNQNKAIQEIKSLMVKFGFMSDSNELQSFKTVDEVIFQVEKLEVGKSIKKINENFEASNVENGTYRLKDHFEITVKDGKISNVKQIFVDAKLEDGTEIRIEGDVIDLGAKVTVLQGDAEVPAPDGSHTLEDGDVITTKDGVITAFDDKGDQEEGETPEAPDVDTDKDTANSGGQDEMVKMLKEFITNMSKKINEMESNYAELQNQFKTFSKLPATKKIVDGKTDFNRATESETDSRLNAILALKNKINN